MAKERINNFMKSNGPKINTPPSTLALARAEIQSLRAELSIDKTLPLPRTLGAAKDEIASLRSQKPAIQAVRKAVDNLPSPVAPTAPTELKSKVAAKIRADISLSTLMVVQTAFDQAPDHASKIQVLQQAADNFKAKAAKAKNPMSLEALDLLKMKAKCEKRLAYELLSQGKLRDAYKYKPEDLV